MYFLVVINWNLFSICDLNRKKAKPYDINKETGAFGMLQRVFFRGGLCVTGC